MIIKMNSSIENIDFSEEILKEKNILTHHSMIENIEPESGETVSYIKYFKLIPYQFKTFVDELGVVARYYALPSIFFANKVLQILRKDAEMENSRIFIDDDKIIWSNQYDKNENSHIMSIMFTYKNEEIIFTFIHPFLFPKGCVVLITADIHTTIEAESYLKKIFDYSLMLISKNQSINQFDNDNTIKNESDNNISANDNISRELLYIKSNMINTMNEINEFNENDKNKAKIISDPYIIVDDDIVTSEVLNIMKSKLYDKSNVNKRNKRKKGFWSLFK